MAKLLLLLLTAVCVFVCVTHVHASMPSGLRLRGGDKNAKYAKMKMSELQNLCKAKKLATGGVKADLIKRLEDAESEAVMREDHSSAGNKRPAHSLDFDEEDEDNLENHDLKQQRTGSSERTTPVPDQQLKQQPRVEVDEKHKLVRVFYSYDIREQLKNAGFSFCKQTKSWDFPLEMMMPKLGVSEPGQITTEAVLKMVESDNHLEAALQGIPGASTPGRKAEDKLTVQVKDGVVRITGDTYHHKDNLKAAGFTWDVASYAWQRPEQEVAEALQNAGLSGECAKEDVIHMIETQATTADVQQPDAAANRLPPEVKIEKEEVLVLNSYDIKEHLKSMGFMFSVERKAWCKGLQETLTMLNLSDAEDITVEALNACTSTAERPMKERAAPSLSFEDGQVLVLNSYDVKEQLRAMGFRWDLTKKAWMMDKARLKVTCGLDEGADDHELTMEAVLKAAQDAPPREPQAEKEPYHLVQDGEVLIFNSYAIKDRIKQLGFRWNTERSAWAKSLSELLADVQAQTEDEITMEKILDACDKADGFKPAQQQMDASQAYIEIDEANQQVRVMKSYAIKDDLRKLEFKWDQDHKAWAKGVAECKVLLGIEDQHEITVEMLLNHAATMQEVPMGPPRTDTPRPPQQSTIQSHLRSPSPAKVDASMTEQLRHSMSSMGHSTQGWSRQGHTAH